MTRHPLFGYEPEAEKVPALLDITPRTRAIAKASGIRYPNILPYTHITFTLVAWNEEARLPALLARVRPVFSRLIVGVQESDDDTLAIARAYADVVIEDAHQGYGDATYPKLQERVETPWTFKLDADEWPSDDLLVSLSHATWTCQYHERDGAWIPFHSWVEGVEYTEQHAHLRLYRTVYAWPGMLHSRPSVNDQKAILWKHGHIDHARSLDEMMQDYLRYWDAGQGNRGWEDHNRLMMYHACTGSAARYGWEYVRSFPWWPRVESIAFVEEQPWRL